jgi:putative sigma-54 modulation protein
MQIELRIRRVNLVGSLQRYVERRLRYALRRLGSRPGRVTVWLSDINGPRGGPDKHCRVSLELNPIGTLTAEGTHPDLYVSISRAAKRMGRLLDHRLGRGLALKTGRESIRTGMPALAGSKNRAGGR